MGLQWVLSRDLHFALNCDKRANLDQYRMANDETKLDVRFRCISTSDLDEVESLHIECLPVRYGPVRQNNKCQF